MLTHQRNIFDVVAKGIADAAFDHIHAIDEG